MDLKVFKDLKDKGIRVIDVRSEADFSAGHIPGSLYMPIQSLQQDLNRHFLYKDMALVAIGEKDQQGAVNDMLKEKGYGAYKGFFSDGFGHWTSAGEAPDMVIQSSLEELNLDVKHDEDMRIIDIRPEEAFKRGHIKKAWNFPFEDLLTGWAEIPKDKTFFVYGEESSHALTIVSYLKMQGRHNFYHVPAGVEECRAEGIPMA